MDSNHRSLTTTDLQSVPFGHSGTPPRYTKPQSVLAATGRRSVTFTGHPNQNDLGNLEFFSTHSKIWSWRWESNPQPADYKSAALPVELRQQQVWKFTVKTNFVKKKFSRYVSQTTEAFVSKWESFVKTFLAFLKNFH